MLSRNNYLYGLQTHSYADDLYGKMQQYGWSKDNVLDCALGTNPFGSPTGSINAYRSAVATEPIAAYPDPWCAELKEEVSRYWSGAGITAANIVVGTGSMGILDMLNTLLLFPGAKVLGYAPQFADYVRSVYTHGAIYQAVPLVGPQFRFSISDLVEKIDGKYVMVYIDNPNNPTGQHIPNGEIETVVQRAAEFSIPVIVDEAYGDFVSKEDSAIYLLAKYPNLVVVRSFSKGLGLAGLRVGYGLLNEELRSLYAKLDNPFSISQAAMAAAIAALRDGDFLIRSRVQVRKSKAYAINSLRNLVVSHSHPETPIITLTAPDPHCDLGDAFLKRGILVVPGVDFPQLTRASVRLRVPADCHRLVEGLSSLEREL